MNISLFNLAKQWLTSKTSKVVATIGRTASFKITIYILFSFVEVPVKKCNHTIRLQQLIRL